MNTEGTFYSDRAGQDRPRTSEDISGNVWAGLTSLIRRQIDEGSLARDYPSYGCLDDHTGRSVITGTNEETFLDDLKAHIPGLIERSAPPKGEEQIEGMAVIIPSAASSVS